MIRQNLAILCKACSRRQARLHPNGYFNGCTYEQTIAGHWKCHDCSDDQAGVLNIIHVRSLLHLMHIHRRKKPKGPGVIFIQGARRARPACPTPGCHKRPWLRHWSMWLEIPLPTHKVDQWSHFDAWYQCLSCQQFRYD